MTKTVPSSLPVYKVVQNGSTEMHIGPLFKFRCNYEKNVPVTTICAVRGDTMKNSLFPYLYLIRLYVQMIVMFQRCQEIVSILMTIDNSVVLAHTISFFDHACRAKNSILTRCTREWLHYTVVLLETAKNTLVQVILVWKVLCALF